MESIRQTLYKYTAIVILRVRVSRKGKLREHRSSADAMAYLRRGLAFRRGWLARVGKNILVILS